MAFFGYGLWPLLAVGGLLLMISLLFCLYLYRLRRIAEAEKGFKMVSLTSYCQTSKSDSYQY